MAWYQLTTDVMVKGTPRCFGEVLDLSVSDGQLLIGLGRATPCDAPKPTEAKPTEAKPAEAKPAEAKPAIQVKPVARRRTPPPTPED